MNSNADGRLNALVSLLYLEKEARSAESQRDLSFVFVNETRKLLPYRQAALWKYNDVGQIEIIAFSNVSEVDQSAPYVQWLKRLVAARLGHSSAAELHAFSANDLDDMALLSGWKEFQPPWVIWFPLRKPGSGVFGGVIFGADVPWGDAEHALADQLSDAYGHAWAALERPKRLKILLSHLVRHQKRYIAAFLLLILFPFKQYVMVPAEVVADDPYIVTAPMVGVIKDVFVQPSQSVKKGQMLFRFELTDANSRLDVALKAFQVAQAEYLKNAQQAFDCESCRAQLSELGAVVEKERAQAEWARQQLERASVKAPGDGVVVFSDVNDWRGRPVSTGEKVMLVSDPVKTRLQINMPVEDVIDFPEKAEIVFFPYTDPLDSYDGTIVSSGYEAQLQPNSQLAYVLYADFRADERARLGMRGTAKVYGGRAPVAYYLLRRPFAWLRRTLGV